MLYLHGVRWNLTGHLNRMSQLRRFGFSVFAIDYRGFGKSDGELPSEATVYEDARAAWQWLVEREPDASRRFIYGHSLGGAVAIDLAAQLSDGPASARGLIVESSFTSIPELVADSGYGLLPWQLLLSQKFDSVGKIQQIRMPVLIVHGEEDRYVPARLSSALYAAAPQPKKLLLIPNGDAQQQRHGRATPTTATRCRSFLGRSRRAGAEGAAMPEMFRRASTGTAVNRQTGTARSGSKSRRRGIHSGLTVAPRPRFARLSSILRGFGPSPELAMRR